MTAGPVTGWVWLPGESNAHFYDGAMQALCGREAFVTFDAMREHARTTAAAITRSLKAGADSVPTCGTCWRLRRQQIEAKARELAGVRRKS